MLIAHSQAKMIILLKSAHLFFIQTNKLLYDRLSFFNFTACLFIISFILFEC